jgi:ankyrin repeat protein
MAESTITEFSTRCTQMIRHVKEGGKKTAEQQYQDILVCMECDHTRKRSDVLADTWKRLQHKIIKARLTDGRHFEACLRKIKVNESSMISNSSLTEKRLVEWCACVSECSKQLLTVNDNLKMTSGSPYPSSNPAPPLHLALILRLEHDVLPKLLSIQTDSLRECDLLNRNVLHVAAECSNSAAIQYILEYNPEEAAQLIHERDRVSRTPILVAAYLSDLECFTRLAGAGANLHDLDVGSLGVLELACRAGNKDIVEFLIDHTAGFYPDGRAGPHAPNPLHNAAKGNFRDVCDFLLARGAHASMRDLSTGKTAAKLAYDHGHHELAWDLCARDDSGVSREQLETPEWLNQLGLDATNFISSPIHSGA